MAPRTGYPDLDFPEDQTPTDDNETPNDDGITSDEDNGPTNHLIYAWDPPRTVITADKAFYIKRNGFREWVRVKLSGTFTNNNGLEEGTRASGKEEWHFLNYLKRDANGKWTHDSAETSYSSPVFSGSGNGAIAVTLLANAVTEGFTATYDKATKKWTLTGTSTDSDDDTQDPAPEGTQWTLTIGTKVQVVITQGSTEFETDDEFKFSIFKTSATDGKKNEINTGAIDVTDGP